MHPELAPHDAFLAIINLAAYDAVVKSKGHVASLPEPNGEA